MKEFKIFAVNPGSTSTKIGLFRNEEMLFSKTVNHDAEMLNRYVEINDQLEFRMELILEVVEENGFDLEGTDAFVGRGGGYTTMPGGTYPANDIMLEHARAGLAAQHPSNLGVQLAVELVALYGGKAYVVNGPTTDEFDEIARVSGFANIYRQSIVHALNQKEVGFRYADTQQRKYQDMNLVIGHLGGGISITAHKKGKMVDSNDVINGDGPMAPTRSGSLPAAAFLKQCFSGEYTERELYDRITRCGGFVDHLGTSDAMEVAFRAENGDEYAKLIYEALIYQVGKSIGTYATVLHGDVDAIILTGGLANDKNLVAKVTEMTQYIAPVVAMPGEFEMEALANGVLRVLRGQEEEMEYTGLPAWSGFEYIKQTKNS